LAGRLEEQGQDADMDQLVFDLGTPRQQAFLLVHQGRFDEALAIAREHFADLPGLVTQFADALVQAGAGSTAEAFASSLLHSRSRATAISWLTGYAKQTGNLSVALDLQRQAIREQPYFETYKAIKELGQQLGSWPLLRPEIIAGLEAKQAWGTLIEIALYEEDIPWALKLLSVPERPWVVAGYTLKVAQAAETDYPQAVLEIYRRRVEALIAGRGRGNYGEAARLLVKVRALLQRQGQAEAWQNYLTRLRQENKQLPALQDELKKAGL
jgi:hypothetical protein